MNKVILVGRLTKDPEIRVTQSGKKVASFSIAVDDGKDSSGQRVSQYFSCSCWDQQAELLEMYVKKGHRLAVVGKLQNRSWDKPDGTKGYATDVSVREIEMLTTKAEAEGIQALNENAQSTPSEQNSVSKNSSAKGATKDGDEENPEDLPEIDVDSMNVQMPF